MEKKKIYIAGPEVFAPNARAIGSKCEAICEKYGFVGLFPLDNMLTSSMDIYRANCALIKECDLVVANLDCFRGQCMDDGTAWEVGYASAIGKPIYGYMADTRSLLTKIGAKDKKGNLVEDFGHPVNLMIYESCVVILQGDFENCVRAISKQ